MTRPTIPKKSSGSYKAARLIYDTGSKTEAELGAVIDFGNERNVAISLDAAIASGWLRRLPDGRFALTDSALEYFDSEPVKDVREIVKPRDMNLVQRAAYKPSKRVPRDDEPAWSERAVPNFYRG
jgi:hypothetical protein